MTVNYEKKIGPVVSVLIPTFNRPQYLSKAPAGALQQSYRNLQVIKMLPAFAGAGFKARKSTEWESLKEKNCYGHNT
jgi:hypothetical protein